MKPNDIRSEFGKKLFEDYFGAYTKTNVHSEKNTDDSSKVAHEDIELTAHDIVKYSQQQGVVGEEDLAVLLTIAVANGKHVVLRGDSGTGKTFLTDTVLGLFSNKYEIGQATDSSVFHDAEAINNSSIIYVPEFQNLFTKQGKGLNAVIKSLSEGKDATRRVTNSSRDGAVTYMLRSGKTIVSTLANENCYSIDRETQRRFIVLETDNSSTITEKIVEEKIKRRSQLNDESAQVDMKTILENRVAYVGNNSKQIINPFLGYLSESFPPVKKVQSLVDHYLDLYESFANFFSKERVSLLHKGKEYVLMDIEDAYNTNTLYEKHFKRELGDFNGKDIDLFRPDWSSCLESGVRTLTQILSDSASDKIDEWYDRQKQENMIKVKDYKTGDMVEI